LHAESEQAVQQAERLGRTVAHRTEVKLERTRALLERLARLDDVKQLDAARCGPVFGLFSDMQADYTNLVTVRSDETRICSAIRPSAQAPTRVDPTLYLSATLASGRFTLGKVTRGIYTDRQILFAALPLPADGAGKSPGVVAVSVDLAALQLVDAEDDLPSGVAMRLVGGSGVVLASNIAPNTQIGSPSSDSLSWWTKASAGSGRLRDAQGVERFYAAAPVMDTDWQAVVDLPADSVLAPARQRALLGAVIVFATLSLALAMAMWILRRAARPIEALADLARRATGQPLMAAGQLPRPNLDRAPREVRALGDDLQAMLEARDAARTQDATLNAMFVGISDALVFTDPQRRIQAVNPAFTALFGYEPEDAIGQTPQLLYADPSLFAGAARGRFERAMAGEHAYYEVLYRRKDGSTFWAESSGQRILSPSGEFLGMLGMHRDITERMRAAQALDESHGRFQALFRHSPVAILVCVCPSGEMVDVNPAFERMLGFEHDQVVGKSSLDLGIWFDSEARAQALAALHSLTAPPDTAAQLRCRSGAIIDVAMSSCRVDIGGVGHLFMLVSDITAEKQAQRILEDHRAQLESEVASRTLQLELANATLAERAAAIADLYDSAPCGYHSLAPDGTVVSINATELRMLGYAREELVQQPFVRLLTPTSQALWVERCSDFVRTGSMQNAEFDVLRKDGTVLPVLISSVLIRDARGQPVSTRSTVVDNGERKAREQQIAAMQLELAQRADEADAANRAKSAFLANMSHEIRTPMNAILGLTHLMLRDSMDALLRTRLQKVSGAARHLLQVINDILDLSKIESGKLVLEDTEFELDDLLAKALALVEEPARAKGLELVLYTGHTPGLLRGDPTRLSQALVNLLANAVKFTSTGFVQLSVAPLADEYDHLMLRFEVQDTGEGIAADALSHVFEAFEQADSSTTRRHGGTGLGLALTRHIAHTMGGNVGVHSELGAGSRFWFTARLRRSSSVAQESTFTPLFGRRALVVDDLPEALHSLRDQLRVLGLQVSAYGDPQDALKAAEVQAAASAQGYDLLVLDSRMGPPDGLTLLSQLRKIEGLDATPAVLVTAHDDEGLRQQAQAAGVFAVLTKPITTSILQDTLQRLGGSAGILVRQDETAAQAEQLLRARLGGKRVLLAEDNPINREVAFELLSSVGLSVELAENGQEAVDLALAGPFDLVLMDMQMPELDGLDAARRLRSAGLTRLPIVAMTANAFGEDRAACLAAGMNDHLAKPVDPERLYATLLRWLPAASVQ
jgi:PAS domain S-box-containing protein